MPLPHDYLEEIARRLEPGMASAFRDSVRQIRSAIDPDRIASLLGNGDIDGVMEAIGLNDPAWLDKFRAAVAEGFVSGGHATHAGIRDLIVQAVEQDIVTPESEARITARLGVRNLPAEDALRRYDYALVREVTNNTRDGIRTALQDGMVAGRNPMQSALDLCGRIGTWTCPGKVESHLLAVRLPPRTVWGFCNPRRNVAAWDYRSRR